MQSWTGCRPAVPNVVVGRTRSVQSCRLQQPWLPFTRQLQRTYVASNVTNSIKSSKNGGSSHDHASAGQQQLLEAVAADDAVSDAAAAAVPPANAEQLLQQMAGQQMLLLQQQVTLLTQLLQQSQQQNAALANQVQQMTQELSSIKQQLQQHPLTTISAADVPPQPAVGQAEQQQAVEQKTQATASTMRQRQSLNMPHAVPQLQSVALEEPRLVQQAEGQSGAALLQQDVTEHQAEQPPAAEAEPDATQAAAAAAASDALKLQQDPMAAAAAEPDAVAVTAADTPSLSSNEDGTESAAPSVPTAAAASSAVKPQAQLSDTEVTMTGIVSGSGTNNETEQQQHQQQRPRHDAYVQSVRRCSSWQQVRTAVEAAAAGQHQLEPWQLLATLRQLSGIMNHSSIDYSSTDSRHHTQLQQQQQQQLDTPADLAAALLQELLNHPGLWSPVQPGFKCSLYPHEIKTLILSCAGLPLKLPFGSNEHLQALYEAALQFTSLTAGETADAAGTASQAVHQDSSLQLSIDQQVQLLGGCLVLGLQPHPQQLQLLLQLPPTTVRSDCSLLSAAFLVFATDALRANRVLANPAAAARVSGALPPDQVAIGDVPVGIFAAALARIAAAYGNVLNAKLGARRMRQLLLLPLVRLKAHLPLLQQQLHQEQQGQQAVQESSADSAATQLQDLVTGACISVQKAIANGMSEPQQHEQHHRQLYGRGRGRSKRGGGRVASSRQGAGAATAATATGGWTVVTAAAALLLMSSQLGCLVEARALGVFVKAAAAQLNSLPDHLLLPVVQLVAASAEQAQPAEATTASQQQKQLPNSSSTAAQSRVPRHRSFSAWRAAVLQHLRGCKGRLPLDQLAAVIIALAQHHTTETDARRSDGTSSSSNFLEDCDHLLADAVHEQLQLVTSKQQQQHGIAYSSRQLAQLLPRMAPAGLQPSSTTATDLLQLILLPLQSQQYASFSAGSQQRVPAQPQIAQAADLAVAYAAAGQLPHLPEQYVVQQLAAAVQQRNAAEGQPGAAPPARHDGTADALSAAEACALVCSLASEAGATSPASHNRSKLGDWCFAMYKGMPQLQGSQLAAFIAALADIGVSLSELLGPRMLEGKAKVSYGMVVAAAASAATAPGVLAATPSDAVAQLAAGVAKLGGRPDAAWWSAVLGRLFGQLSSVGAQQMQKLLAACEACGVTVDSAWLQEACEVVLQQYNQQPVVSSSLQELQQQSTASTATLITCSCLLAQLGAVLPQPLQQALIAAADRDILQQYAGSNNSSAHALPAATAAKLLADAGCVLARSGAKPDSSWLSAYAAVAGTLLAAAAGDSCCMLTAAVAELGCQLAPAGIKELQKQLDAKVSEAHTVSICRAISSLHHLGASPSALLANALVIKTQQQLMTTPAADIADARSPPKHNSSSSSSTVVLPGGLPAADLASAVWALAVAGAKLPPTWCAAVVKQLAAVAAQLQLQPLLQTLYAAVTWHVNPLPRPLLVAVQQTLGHESQQQLDLPLSAGQLSSVASALLKAGSGVPEPLLPYLPADEAAAATADSCSSSSLADRAATAALADALWQEARRVLQDSSITNSSSTMDADILQAAASGLSHHTAAVLGSYLKPSEKWAQVLQSFAVHQQRVRHQSNGGSAVDLLAVQDIKQFVQLVASVVQQMPSTAHSKSGGPATLTALVALQSAVQPAWLAALVSDMDSQANSKSSWFKQASAKDILTYVQALAAIQHTVSAHQLEALVKNMPSKVQGLSTDELLQLLELLSVGQTEVTGQQQYNLQCKRRQQQIDDLVHAVLPLLLSAAPSEQLQQHIAQRLVCVLVRVASSVLAQHAVAADAASNSSNTSSSGKPASAVKKGAGTSSSRHTQALTVDQVLQLLHAALQDREHHSLDSSSSASEVQFLLGCLQLATTIPANMRPQEQCQQILNLFVHVVSQQDASVHPRTAAQLFIPAVALAVTVNPDIPSGSGRPDTQLGGCLVQLLMDVEAEWHQVGTAELAHMPRMAALVHLELTEPQEFIRVVVQRQQELVQLAKVAPSAVQEAAAVGAGPVQLLNVAVYQVMNRKVAAPGNSTWEGLKQFISTTDNSVDNALAGAEDSSDEQLNMIPAVLFEATNEAVARITGSLSASDICDLLHCFAMASQGSRGCTWMQQVQQKLFSAKEVAKLTPNQQQALLVVYTLQLGNTQQPGADLPVAVLQASVGSLDRWPATMLPYTLQTLGSLALRWEGDIPEQLLQGLLTWQQAAVAAISPRLHLLPAQSYVQLLRGCTMIDAALQEQLTLQGMSPEDVQGHLQGLPGRHAVDACLRAAVLAVSGMLEQLQAQDYIRLMAAVGHLDGVGPAISAELLARLEPHLRTLSFVELVDAASAYAACPSDRQPQMSESWAETFLQAAQQQFATAMPVSVHPDRLKSKASADTVMPSAANVNPSNLVQLVNCLTALPLLPGNEWRAQLMLVTVAQITSFTSQQAAEMLYALARWKAAVGVTLVMAGKSDAEAKATADAAFDSCIMLYDALMHRAANAGGITLHSYTSRGGLTLQALQLLPSALQSLNWPPDEALVQQIMGYLAGYKQQVVASADKIENVLQGRKRLLQQVDTTVDKKAKRQQVQPSVQQRLQNQRTKLQSDVAQYEGMLEQATMQLQAVDAIAQDWEQMLQHAEDLSRRVAALESSDNSTLLEAMAARSGANRTSAAHGVDDRLAGSSSGLNIDQLMSGMMQAAGVSQTSSTVDSTDGNGVFSSVTPSEIDAILSSMLAQQYDADADESDTDQEDYIDTVAEDV